MFPIYLHSPHMSLPQGLSPVSLDASKWGHLFLVSLGAPAMGHLSLVSLGPPAMGHLSLGSLPQVSLTSIPVLGVYLWCLWH